MKELKGHSGLDWNAWFWVDKEEFPGEWKIGQCRYRVEKAVGRDNSGRLIIMEWINLDKYDSHKFAQNFYEIELPEYVAILDNAIRQGEVKPQEREHLIAKAKAPFFPPWDTSRDIVVYRDERFVLGQQYGRPYLIAEGSRYYLSCQPYEPCLYITDEDGCKTAVHNAFDPFDVLDSFYRKETITSITGREIDAKDFCKMVEYAAGMADISISVAESVLPDRAKKKTVKPDASSAVQRESDAGAEPFCASEGCSTPDDPFYALIAQYPDCVVDYCIVKDDLPYCGIESHRRALAAACRNFFSDGEETLWHGNAGSAEGRQITVEEFLSSAYKNNRLNYRKAFLYPPHENGYSGVDFIKINAALFPNGTDGLVVFEWTTDWSDYFDEGHEWWGALCLTVFDKSLDRFVVIFASATD